ncbi:MGMT family protein [Actinacidiphila yeochonensis]|uniref:MGMT family protein n=1 Tax=Actinacidiphila yeochonensis TaxID=89050 RepID=UPI00099D54B7|nr:MGMT family protein [Actinacidiphila yeochonensis]
MSDGSGRDTGRGGSGGAARGTDAEEPAADAEELEPYVERVLDAVDAIPAGRVMTYGDVAEWIGEGGPRQVGRVLSHYGGSVPWWRVVRADGTLLPGHELRALDAYRAEGTPLRPAGRAAEGHVPRLDMRRARWDGTPQQPGAAPSRTTRGDEGDGEGAASAG